MNIYERIRAKRTELNMSQQELARRIGFTSRSAISKIELGERDLPLDKVGVLAAALNTTPEYLMGWEENVPALAEDTVSIEIIGDVAAGYNRIADINVTGDRVDIPSSWLRGRPLSDYFALRVVGNSMYPLYMNGDIVVVLKQSTLNRSGEIGVVVYGDEMATLKKIEYVMGEDWMRLIPINPSYEPITVEGEDLEHCRVLGIPKMLVRSLE